MTFQFDADKRRSVFGWWQMLIFASLLLVFFIILFPKKLFTRNLLKNAQPSDVSISYLKNTIEREPSNKNLKFNLAEQEFKIGNIIEAKKILAPYVTSTPKTEFDWKVSWLNYQITRIQTFAINEGNPQRKLADANLKMVLAVLVKSPYLQGEHLVNVADDALAFNEPTWAFPLYKKAMADYAEQPITFYEKAAKVALYAKNYQGSADTYLKAMHRSSSIEEKRIFYMKAVDALNAAGSSSVALTYAQKNIDMLSNDPQTLTYIAKLAISAGKQKAADHYINQILHLQVQEQKE